MIKGGLSLESVLGGRDINEIFLLDGPPTVTFVEPPRFAELQLALRTMGTGLIVEGPSKVGKSTAIRKAMEVMGVAGGDQTWWYGQRPPPLDAFRKKLDELLGATRKTWLFIDDFHHLEDERYRRELASAMKVLADQPVRYSKVTLIGINPLGSSLVQVMPDLDGRFRIIRLDVDKDWHRSTKIAERGSAVRVSAARYRRAQTRPSAPLQPWTTGRRTPQGSSRARRPRAPVPSRARSRGSPSRRHVGRRNQPTHDARPRAPDGPTTTASGRPRTAPRNSLDDSSAHGVDAGLKKVSGAGRLGILPGNAGQ